MLSLSLSLLPYITIRIMNDKNDSPADGEVYAVREADRGQLLPGVPVVCIYIYIYI